MQRRQRLDLIHKHPAYPTVERVLLGLSATGHQAVLAGGAVRDALLGLNPKDLDVATSAPPDLVESTFRSTLAVGKAFGTIVVIENGFNFEVTTFRTEGPYLDGRHPSKVEFSGIEEDAKRRDFTVNAFFYDPEELVIYDFAGGLEDLQGKCLRTVGLAKERFREDHLRMLRAVRFVAQLGFAIESETMAAMASLHQRLSEVSSERILNEMQRLLAGPYVRQGLRAMVQSKLHLVCWPELAKVELDQLTGFLTFPSWENAFAALSLLGGADPEPRLRAWKASRDSIRKVKAQIEGVRILLDEKSTRAGRIRALGGAEFAHTLVLASGLLALTQQRRKLDGWIKEYLEVAGPDGELPKPLLSGDDLLANGIPASDKMGRILKTLFDAQLDGKIASKEQALKMLRSLGDGSAI